MPVPAWKLILGSVLTIAVIAWVTRLQRGNPPPDPQVRRFLPLILAIGVLLSLVGTYLISRSR